VRAISFRVDRTLELGALSAICPHSSACRLHSLDVIIAAVCAGRANPPVASARRPRGRATEKRDELAPSQLIGLHWVPAYEGRIARYRIRADPSAGMGTILQPVSRWRGRPTATRTPPSRPRASARSRALACNPHDAQKASVHIPSGAAAARMDAADNDAVGEHVMVVHGRR
jgi:hypothetical protein